MVDFGSEHLSAIAVATAEGLSVFATAGIVDLFRGLQKSENDSLGQKMLFSDRHEGGLNA